MPDGTLPRAAVRAYVDGLGPRERAHVGEDVLAAIRDGGYELDNPFDAVDAGIRRTLAVSRIDVPGGTHVGAFPHRSLHARTHSVEGGTLILLDTGLRPLLDRVAATLVASQLTPARDEQGASRYAAATLQQRQQREEADAAFADAVTAYLRRDLTAPETPNAFGFFMARSAERFALGHEYGHLLAGHRHTPPDDDPRNSRREYEADELAAMLILRGVDEGAEFRWRALAVAGPFLFLAVEQLVNRVRGTTDGEHLPPARRTELLRRIFEQAGARGLLHFAEAWVSSLVLREETIVRRARG
ncbi:ImmA/IrrE family metallo-endopeptidase [Actinoplanes sp. NPDC004185]